MNMRRLLFLLLCVWCISLSGQNAMYVFKFDHVSPPNSDEKVKGFGKVTVYDNREVEIYGKIGNKTYSKRLTFVATGGSYTSIFLYSSGDDASQKREPQILIMTSGIGAIYSDLRNGKYYLGLYNFGDTNNDSNERNYSKMENDLKQRKGAFSTFHGLNDNELPYRLEVPDGLKLKADDISKGEYSGLATYEGGLVGIILHTKTGKYPEDAGLPQYKAEISPMKGQTVDWLSIYNDHPNCLAIKIEPNLTSRSRAANIYLKVNGEVQGRLFVLQLAKGSQIDW